MWLTIIKDFLFKPSVTTLIEREIDESERLLITAHTNQEHWQSQINLHNIKLKRLKASWNTLRKEQSNG